MPPIETFPRPFEPGTTGWSAQDLDDPAIEEKWVEGSYEIIDGVLTSMAPAYFAGGRGLFNVMFACQAYMRDRGIGGSFAIEPEIIIDDSRVLKPDAAMMTPQDESLQDHAATIAGRPDPKKSRLFIAPTLIIESVSPGHERHDRKTKFRWYAEFKVPNYWILNAFERSLVCWILDGATYRLDASARDAEEIRPSLFPGLVIPLATIWG